MTVQILQGNVLDTLKSIEDGTVRCAVTSPPYYGLRSYLKPDDPLKQYEIGTEETPELYIAKLVQVFRGVWDALADDGTLWLNLGDSYASAWSSGRRNVIGNGSRDNRVDRVTGTGYKEKDLMMIPARVAIALQQDGWYLRSEIVWHKPNPMPESVKDRPTRSHEMIYLLSKSEKYYYDYEAIAEDRVTDEGGADGVARELSYSENSKQNQLHKRTYTGFNERWDKSPTETRNKRDVWIVTTKPYSGAHFATFNPELIEPCILAGSAKGDTVLDPFGGSGTTAAVALQHGRNAIVCELNAEYLELMHKRFSEVQYQLV